MKKYLCLMLYYSIARHLPYSSNKFAKQVRYQLCRHIFKECGKNVNIEKGAWFGTGKNIVIGDNSGIGINARILNNTIIGKDVMMGPNFYILESTHLFDRIDIPMRKQGRVLQRACVVIEDDVWIGREVMVIGSKTIKKGSIIGARTLLTKNYPEYSIIGGNPSKLIRTRT